MAIVECKFCAGRRPPLLKYEIFLGQRPSICQIRRSFAWSRQPWIVRIGTRTMSKLLLFAMLALPRTKFLPLYYYICGSLCLLRVGDYVSWQQAEKHSADLVQAKGAQQDFDFSPPLALLSANASTLWCQELTARPAISMPARR